MPELARSVPSCLERGSVAHLGRSSEKSSACAIAPDLLEPNILGDERCVAQTKDDVGRRETNMTQITSIKLGLIAMCIATVPCSLAQRPRAGTSGSNQTGVTTPALAGHSGFSGNSTSAGQLGTNPPSSMSTAPNTNAGAHIGINPGVQTGISNPTGGIIGGPAAGLGGLSGNSTNAVQLGTNAPSSMITRPNTNAGTHIGINPGAQTGINNQTGGITGSAAMGLAGSSGNSTGTTETGANTRAGANTTANTNAGTHAAAAAATPPGVTTILPQSTPLPIQSLSPNPNFSTAGQSPSPVPSASVTPTPTPTPVQSL
jgi:hypothetical protein